MDKQPQGSTRGLPRNRVISFHDHRHVKTGYGHKVTEEIRAVFNYKGKMNYVLLILIAIVIMAVIDAINNDYL